MKDHEIRELVNAVTQAAREYAGAEQLRERIRRALAPAIDLLTANTSEVDQMEMIVWAYRKLHHSTFSNQHDALMLDRMKLFLTGGAT